MKRFLSVLIAAMFLGSTAVAAEKMSEEKKADAKGKGDTKKAEAKDKGKGDTKKMAAKDKAKGESDTKGEGKVTKGEGKKSETK